MRIANFPTRVIEVSVSDASVQLHTVRRLEDYVDLDALLRDPDPPEPPYWAHLWTASRVLARLTADEIDCRGKRVVEIGCGLGLVGIVAALRGADATMFDFFDEAVRFAQANVALNRCTASVLRADLNHPPFRGGFDVCLAADVTYETGLQKALARFLALHLARAGRAWCVESVRTYDPQFQQACKMFGLQTRERMVNEIDEGRTVPVRVTEVWRSGKIDGRRE
ncbi:MAG: methyltransferase [Deltaproteobacteria bacterium]|nr:methyltransferase [Deltaproteobacteria bacterium]